MWGALNKTRFIENGSYTGLAREMISSNPIRKKIQNSRGTLDLKICLEFQTLKVAFNSRMKSIDAVFQAGFNGKFNIGSLIIKLWSHLLEKFSIY